MAAIEYEAYLIVGLAKGCPFQTFNSASRKHVQWRQVWIVTHHTHVTGDKSACQFREKWAKVSKSLARDWRE